MRCFFEVDPNMKGDESLPFKTSFDWLIEDAFGQFYW